MSVLLVLAYGLLAIFAVSGVGGLMLRFLCPAPLPWHWHIGLRAIAGQAAVMASVEALLLSGDGTPRGLRWLGISLVGAAIVGHLSAPRIRPGTGIATSLRGNKLMTGLICAAWMVNFVVALAPSTKIDELNYHMLMPKRIVEDGGLRFYQLPLEAAVLPHMHYQIALSVLHAAGAPDAGNLLSFGYSVVLTMFLIGVLLEATGNGPLSMLAGALCTVGLYATVWHTTGGPHALGDLATLVAVTGILLPEPLLDALGPIRYSAILVTAACVSAATKLSLWPLALIVSMLVVYRATADARAARKRPAILGAALLPWAILHLPLTIWTYVTSGSPWGPVFANVLGPSAFAPAILRDLDTLQGFTLGAAMPNLRYALIEWPPICFAAIAWVVWMAWRGNRVSELAGILIFLQGALVVWKFRSDFRFMGGLEYVAVLAAVLSLELSATGSRPDDGHAATPSVADWLVTQRYWVVMLAAVPWLGGQIYYARPFAEVVIGITTRQQFLERYAPLTGDFDALDRILPRDAVLYIYSPDVRVPSFYVPRPMVLTPLDLHGRKPVYRLALAPAPGVESIDAASRLRCGENVYANDRAVLVAFRTPGAASVTGPVSVQSCQVEDSREPPGR
jgi:hypothetical protein